MRRRGGCAVVHVGVGGEAEGGEDGCDWGGCAGELFGGDVNIVAVEVSSSGWEECSGCGKQRQSE